MKKQKSPTIVPRVIVRRVGKRCPADITLDSPQAIHDFWINQIQARKDHEPDKEHLVAVITDIKFRLVGYSLVSIGSLSETVAQMREIFRPALLIGGYALALVHNHPSGDPGSSVSDRQLTRQASEAATLLQIIFFDHVIIGDGSFYSFRDSGLL